MMSQEYKNGRENDRVGRIRWIVNDCLQRWAKGESYSEEALYEAHRDLMPELGKELERVRRLAEAAAESGTEFIDRYDRLLATATCAGGSASSRALRIRCPHCRNAIELLPESPFSSITCQLCGSTFSIVGRHTDTSFATPLKTVGHFEFIERIGVGAFGTVWKAHDIELDRTVAVKIPRRGQLDPLQEEQFLREARVAAQLRHPNIVNVHEVGRDEDTLFIVSDLVRGIPLSEWLEVHRPTIGESTDLITKVTDALHYAHEQGVVHRDLKPSNVMVDGEGQPHLMDFGLAKRDVGEVTMTVDGRMLGTPAYMSPEQARGEAHHVDRRTDIYSLGVMLYELFTGHLPFRGTVQMLRYQVLHEEPPSPRKLNHRLPRDLETICLKCLEKEPVKRYDSAQQVGDELRRFLKGEPIRARPISSSARTWRWCKRNPWQAVVAALVLLITVASPLIAIHQSALKQKAERETQRATVEANRANREAKNARVATKAEYEARMAAQQESERANRLLYVANINLAHEELQRADVPRAIQLLEILIPRIDGERDLRGFEWYYLWRECHRYKSTMGPHPTGITALALTTDGTTAATGGEDGKIRLWNMESRMQSKLLDINHLKISSLQFSPDHQKLAIGSQDKKVVLWDFNGEEMQVLGQHANHILCVAFSADGSLLATASSDHTVRLWQVVSGEEIDISPLSHGEGREDSVLTIAFSPEGDTLASREMGGTVHIWDLKTGKPRVSIDVGTAVNDVDISPDGKILATAGENGKIMLWNIQTGETLGLLSGHKDYVSCLAFSPDGKLLASGSGDWTTKIWDVDTRADKATLKAHGGYVTSVIFSPKNTLVSASSDGMVMIWDLQTLFEENVYHVQETSIDMMAVMNNEICTFSRTGNLTGKINRLQLAPNRVSEPIQIGEGMVLKAALSPDGNRLAIYDLVQKKLSIWDTARNHELWNTLDHDSVKSREIVVRTIAFSPDGQLIVTVANTKEQTTTIRLWDAKSGSQKLAALDIQGSTSAVAFSPDHTLLACGDTKGNIEILSMEENTRIARQSLHRDRIESIQFSPDGTCIASAGADGTVSLWHLRQKTPHILGSHLDRAKAVTFSQDGKTLASGGADDLIKLWDVAAMQLKTRVSTHIKGVECLGFAPDGSFLAAGHKDGTIRLWHATSND